MPVEAPAKTPLKLNLGCGQAGMDGFVGVDIVKTPVTDVVLDLEVRPWPWEDSSVERVVSLHVLEHLNDPVGFMNELYRVMASGGRAVIVVPHAQSYGAWQDPTHKRAINEKFFMYFSKKFRDMDGIKVDHYPVTCDFEIEGDINYQLEDEWKNKSDQEKAYAIKHLNNVIIQFCVVLKCIK